MRCRRPARTFRVVRLPAGFANHTTPETQSLFRLLCIRAWAAAGVFFNSTGNAALATKYSALAAARTRDIRNMSGSRGGPWYGDFGLHAGSDAVNAGVLTVDERAAIAAGADREADQGGLEREEVEREKDRVFFIDLLKDAA